ncbi:exopolysaccharide biosynthesis protein [Chroococcidiopsis sp. TS-821]|uniref:exopolysaccharide biosynthesis protein n=1 Tax=Chroococcidiopsis sp. TS-821 TaxID=1378066 RepID=UPI000CEEC80F|nr:exopolysaccharide biosynthesis protein [Chroococcidiopsis sp. TS-821]PPS40406.1 exopolysaccharide biosynthesis protein [Chroococcidiopsis sp. TS-821]
MLRFSQDIKLLLEKLASQPLTIGEILAETSERGFSLVIALLVLPFLFPMPPGFTGPLGSGCLLLSLQMAVGRRSPWLPKKVAQFRFSRHFTVQILQNLRRVTRVVEKIARPRWTALAESRITWQLNGLCISWLTILLISPIPFTNPIPTVGILLFAVATLESDGLLMCVSYVLTALITLIVVSIGYTLWQAPNFLPSIF